MALSDAGHQRSPIRVLQVITSLGIGGAERLVVSAARGLSAPRFEHAICCLAERGPLAAEAEAAAVPVFCVDEFPGLRHPFAFARLIRIIRAFRPTIVHTHLQSANLYGRLAARLARVPVVVATEHNVYVGKAHRYILVERFLARMTDAMIAVSGPVRQFLSVQLALPPSTIRVIHNGVALSAPTPSGLAELRERLGTDGTAAIRLGTVASLTAKKGHEVLLRAVARLQGNGIVCSLVVAGEGPDRRRLESLSQRLGVSTHVHFLGHVPHPADVLDAIDVFVLPSLAEGLPLALLEAMYAGRACVATAVGGVPEVIRPGDNGLLVPPGDEAALAEAISTLVRSVDLRRRLGVAARQAIEDGFTEARYLESLTALYRELAEPHVRTPHPLHSPTPQPRT
jgi:glycosyltransferase involved in cell wall biosynthesis